MQKIARIVCTQYPKKNGHISERIFFRCGEGGIGNGGKSDLFGNTSAAVDFYKFRWDLINTDTLLFVYYQKKLVKKWQTSMCSISFLSSENDLEGLQEGH